MSGLSRTVCKQGHPRTPENLLRRVVAGHVGYICSPCHKEQQRQGRARKRAAKEALGIRVRGEDETNAEYFSMPHCIECGIGVGEGHIEPSVNAEGLCSDCANRFEPAHLAGIGR